MSQIPIKVTLPWAWVWGTVLAIAITPIAPITSGEKPFGFMNRPLPGYRLYKGNTRDKALLLEFLTLTYQSLFPEQGHFPHLNQTIDSYFSWRSPLWWVSPDGDSQELLQPIAGLWLGNAIDQVTGDRYGHVFMLYVDPNHRRRGIASALLNQAQQWGQQRGDQRLGLQVFTHNQGAIALYEKLGFTPRALLLEKQW